MSEKREAYDGCMPTMEWPARTGDAEEWNHMANPFVIPVVKPDVEVSVALSLVTKLEAACTAWRERYEREFLVSERLALENAHTLAEIEQLKADRSEQAQEIIRQLKEKKELADTISELREKLEQKSDALSAMSKVIEDRKSFHAESRLYYEKCKVEMARLEANAKLGALVRQMPTESWLSHEKPGKWKYRDMVGNTFGDSVEEALKNVKDGV